MSSSRESAEGIEVLVVEDSRTQAELLAHILLGAGYRVRMAADGAEALASIRDSRPSLVISDVVMPIMDGYSMCRAIKDEASLSGMPVIILTALSDAGDVLRGIEAGMDFYLAKPYRAEALLARIEDALSSFASREGDEEEESFEVALPNENRVVRATRQRLSTLLVSTYEGAVQRNRELQATQMELETLNRRQEELVEELGEAKSAAEEANRAKSGFLGLMSHDLRTLLNSIIGFTEVLQDQMFGPLAEKQQEHLGYVDTSSRHLLSLIDDILDVSKIEAGTMKMEYGPVGVKLLVEGSLVMVREKALKHSIGLSVTVSAEADLTIRADERKLKQVLYNLLSNAVKFTPDGGSVAVRAKRSGEMIELCVEDTGIGIAADQMATLFTRFGQLEGAYDKKYEGTGLGLSLVKEFAALHGGEVRVESESGRGSRFYATIPIGGSA